MESLATWLGTPPTKNEVLDPFGAFCLLLHVPGFVVSAYLAGPGADRLAKNPIQLTGIRHWASIGLWLFGAGLFFVGVRAMQINPLSLGQPIWLLGSVVATVIVAARCVDWWRTVYPTDLACGFAATVTRVTGLGSYVGGASAKQSVPESTTQR
jgi:hypothetical protein